ncbi:MAG: hypothetical protein IJ223_00070 [Clostridia bacterium]|nr:hypothetical protein [Clostridia bacterium]
MTKTKKESKKKFLMILLVVLLLALAVGYAVFTDTLTITGTANIDSRFDVKFTSANVASKVGCTATAEIGNQSGETDAVADELTVTVEDLAYPGAGAQIHAVITNAGTIPVKITGVTTPTPPGNGNAIVISGLDQITTNHPTLQANGTCSVDFTVMWDPEVTELDPTKDGENDNSYSFTFTITYEQDMTAFTGTPAHTDA